MSAARALPIAILAYVAVCGRSTQSEEKEAVACPATGTPIARKGHAQLQVRQLLAKSPATSDSKAATPTGVGGLSADWPVSKPREFREGAPGLSSMLLMLAEALHRSASWEFDPFGQGRDAALPQPNHESSGNVSLRFVGTPSRVPWSGFFTAAAFQDWLILGLAALLLYVVDFLVFQRTAGTFSAHMASISVWITAGVCFNIFIWCRFGQAKAFEWCSGYILEWMLSVDNIFVFHLIFQKFQTPMAQVHKAVFVGIIGAIVMRMFFFMLLSSSLHLFSFVRLPFGLMLIWSGIEAAKGQGNNDTVADLCVVRGLKRCFGSRLMERYDDEGTAFFLEDHDGNVKATMLLLVVVCLEFADLLFAVDSVSAKVAQIPDQYVAFSSSVLAMFALRAMFFVVQDIVGMFDLMQYGLCIILVFIGVELVFAKYIHFAAGTVCIAIVAVFVICMVGSAARSRMTLAATLEAPPDVLNHLAPAQFDTEKSLHSLGY